MTPSQKNEDLNAFEEWLNYSYSECSDFNEVKFGDAKIPYKASWLAALEYERERMKRETAQDDERDADTALEREVYEKGNGFLSKPYSNYRFHNGFLAGRRTCACRNLTKEKT